MKLLISFVVHIYSFDEKMTESIFYSQKLRAFASAFRSLFFILSWRQIVIITLKNFLTSTDAFYLERVFVYSAYYIPLIASSFAVTFFALKKRTYLYLWFFVAITSSVLYFLFETFTGMMLFALLGGISFGIGFPFCFSYFAEGSSIENRGKNAGVAFFIIVLFFLIFAIFSETYGVRGFMVFSIGLMIIGLTTLLLLKPKQLKREGKEVKRPFFSIFSDRRFIFYFIPWVMLCLIDTLEVPILRGYLQNNFGAEFEDFLLNINTMVTACFILLSGILADRYGRRKILILSFVIFGIAYATIGTMTRSIISWYVYFILNGVAWGLFAVIYTFVIWADLSSPVSRDRYYVIGLLPYFVMVPIRELITPYITLIPVYAAFSFASFFLFLAVWPLFNAPETLPEELLEARRLRSYVEKAKKIREKHERKLRRK